MSEQNPWKKISTKLIYKNPWITVREDSVLRPDGTPGIYGVVEAKIAVAVIAIEEQDLYLVGQYRYPVDKYSWEIIEGGCEQDESTLETAKRELKEEAGLIAERWELLGGQVQLSNCFTNEIGVIYLASDLKKVKAEPEPTEILKIKKVNLNEAYQMLESGQIEDSLSIIGLYRLKSRQVQDK